MVGIIGGTGFAPTDGEKAARTVRTRYGRALLQDIELAGRPAVFLPRHGPGHVVPPHQINFRANIAALQSVGVRAVFATAAAGGLKADLEPGALLVLDQFLDFTRGRPLTFFEGEDGKVVHTDMTNPYCPRLRGLLVEAGKERGLAPRDGGTYVCVEGPRFETAAEIRMFAALGGDVIGMTGVPEVVLAREAGMCYAAVAVVTNPGAGLTGARLEHGEVERMMEERRGDLWRLFEGAAPAAPVDWCEFCRGTHGAS